VRAARIAPGNTPYYAAIATLLAASVVLQVVRDRGWQPYEPPAGLLWVRSGAFAQRLALGFDNLAADVYWMRAVVYFGGERRIDSRAKNYDQLYPLLDLVTTLDPHFRVAYRFGAVFLGEEFPGGAGRPDLAVQLLEKGLNNDPARWEYAADIGFVHYWWSRDYNLAAEWFKRGGEIPGGAEWLGPLAAVTLAEGGNRQSSRVLWTQLRDHAGFEWIRQSADRRLQQLDAMDAIDELNRTTQSFMKRHGRPPGSWAQLAADQRWRAMPFDPSGTLYELDAATGAVGLSTKSRLWPLPAGAAVSVPQ
jgi:hypothetical protein